MKSFIRAAEVLLFLVGTALATAIGQLGRLA